jgi:hypothetical protein
MKYYWLAGEFNLTCPPVEAGRIYLIVDGEQKKDVFINNVRVATSKPCIVWDRENRSFDLTANLKQGKNIVVFRSPTSSYLSKEVIGEFSSAINPRDVEPLVIQGRFGVFKKQGVIRIIKLRPEIRPGSWTSQGYPNFSGTGIYKQDFSFAPAKGRRYWLDLGNVRDTVEIILNSKKVSTLAWHPFRTEITGFLKAGRNRIELRVSNNFGNLLKKFYGRVLDDKPIPAGLLAAPVIYVTN